MQERLIELETKFSFQEDMLNELNEIIIKQQRELDRLRLELGEIRSQLDDMRHQQQSGADLSGADEKPPHY